MQSLSLSRLGGALVLAAGAWAGTAPSAVAAEGLALTPAARQAAKTIDRAAIEAPIRFLSDDLLEGRGPASRGDQLTQLYLATTLQLLGYQPAGPDGSYLQNFDVVGVETAMPETWTFQAQGKAVPLRRLDEYIANSGLQSEQARLDNAEVVFVGYGIEAPEYRWDDFKGADLKGKVLLMLNNDPDEDPQLFAGNGRLYYGRWTYKYESAARQGAAGAIILHTTPSAGYGWNVVRSSWTGEQFSLPAGDEPRLQVAAWATEEATRRLLAAAGQDLDRLIEIAKRRDFRPIPLGITTSLDLTAKVSRVKTANVLGLLPGSDPKLQSEVVLYSAHHDHLGIGEADKTGDTIYNGAEDNAAGCALVLAMAKAFAGAPERPKRSILVAFVGGEEQGLLGSQYYAAHPTVAPGKIAANLNFDGGNFLGRTRDLTYVGLGRSSLDRLVVALAAEQKRKVLGDQHPDRGSYYRSDQFSFARIGVPAIYLGDGSDFIDRPAGWGEQQQAKRNAESYHQPSDEFDPKTWTFDGMIEDAQLGFLAGFAIANDPALPTWTPGDEFEAARKAALATP